MFQKSLLLSVLLLVGLTPHLFAKVYSFQAGDYHIIYADQKLTNVSLRLNGHLIWRDGTLRTDQFLQVRLFFSDRISLDSNEWNGWWYQAPSIDSDAGYDWTIRGIENKRGRFRELKVYRKLHLDFPLD